MSVSGHRLRVALIAAAIVSLALMSSAQDTARVQSAPSHCPKSLGPIQLTEKNQRDKDPFPLRVCAPSVEATVPLAHAALDVITFAGTPALQSLKIINIETKKGYLIPLDEVLELNDRKVQKHDQHLVVKLSDALEVLPESSDPSVLLKLIVMAVPDPGVSIKPPQNTESIVEGIEVRVKLTKD